MRGVSPVVTTVLLVGITIAAAVIAFTWISSSTQSLQHKVSAVPIGTGMFSIAAARMTTPYTWEVVVTDISGRGGSLEGLRAVVKKDGKVCGVSKGFLADVNELSPYGSAKLLFYGDLDCRLDEDGDWTITVSGGAYSTEAEISPPSDVYLWIPFKSVHDMDWSGKHEVYFHSDDGLATFYGYHDGDAVGFDWDKDIVEGVYRDALWFDGVDTKVKGYNIPFPPADSNYVTVAFWMYWSGKANVMPFGWDTSYDLWIPGDDCFGFNTGAGDCLGIPATALKNKWVHVVAIFPIESNFAKLSPRMYINGQEQTLAQIQNTYNPTRVITSTVHVSGWGPTTGYIFSGMIDDVRIYDRPLTDEEIQALYRGEDIRDGLVLYYTFDRNTVDTDNNKVYDVHMWGPGAVGQGIWCDGNGDFASIAVTTELNISGSKQATLLAWVSLPRISTTSYSVNVGYSGTSGRASMTLLYWNTGNRLQFWVETENNYSAVSYTTSPWGNKHVLLVGVYDEPCLRLYFDGNLVGERCDFVGGLAPLAYFSVGKWAGNYHIGGIDEVRVYNRALSEEEIKCIYENPECLIDDENIVAYYTFDYPDKAWQSVPDWHHASRAPEIHKKAGSYYVRLHEGRDYFVIPPTNALFAPYTVSITAKLEEDLGPLPSTFVGTRYPQDFSFDAKFSDDLQRIHGDLGTGSSWLTVTADVPCTLELNRLYTIVYEIGSNSWCAFVDNISNCGLLANRALFADSNHQIFIGQAGFGKEFFGGSITHIFVVPKLLSNEETNAICKLFETC